MTYLAISAGALLLGLGLSLLQPVSVDEAWFLVVINRTRRRQRLYRDVFFGAGPLPVWAARAVVWALRPQVIVVRSLSVIYLMAVPALAGSLVESEDFAATLALLFVATIAVSAPHLQSFNNYSLWTSVWITVAALGTTLGQPILVGFSVAMAVGGKYSSGLAGGLMVLGANAVIWDLESALACAAVAVGVLGAIGLGGGRRALRSFLEVAVRNKGEYIASGRIGPIAGLRAELARDSVGSASRALAVVAYAVVTLAGVVAVASLAIGLKEESAGLLLGGVLGLSAIASAFPRFDMPHIRAAFPLAILGLAVAFGALTPTAASIATAVFGLLLVFGAVEAVRRLRSSEFRWDVPRCRGLPVSRRRGAWPDETGELREATGGLVFLLQGAAPLFYLAGGLVNPTRYDYPFTSTFGSKGQRIVIEAIKSGDIEWVCHLPMRGPLVPVELQEFVASLPGGARTRLGRLVHTAPADV